MTYMKRDDVPVDDGEIAVELETGDVVALKCDRTVDRGNVLFVGSARAVKDDGSAVLGADGKPVERVYRHTDPRGPAADQIAKDVLMALIGEPTSEIVQWSAQMLIDVNIRQALALATINPGAFDASSVL
ncbi:hypothetical protein [Stenotrophomonas lacuserhaii]|uniref:hypothetical protein n=1 Tax=Stenotrophomonas lacuserhaii TaxID=2760084 RepID=UPI0015FA10FC|nr:hypothetical protein [Stenotrophomonas lacuserhaii]